MAWIAYVVPKEDHHLIVEDGLGLMAIGATRETAIANLQEIWDKDLKESNERAVAGGYEPDEPYSYEEWGVLHTNEV